MAQATQPEVNARANSGQRFYMLAIRHRHALWGDIGHLLKIQGVVVGGEGAQSVLMLPDAPDLMVPVRWHILSAEQWVDFLQRADDPEVLVMPAKAFHRKLRYEISGWVQQKIWKADGLKCMYCGRSMGEVQLTVDHFVPLELGGANDTSNYLTACRKCNKAKGAEDPRLWCHPQSHSARTRHGYEFYVQYLAERKVA